MKDLLKCLVIFILIVIGIVVAMVVMNPPETAHQNTPAQKSSAQQNSGWTSNSAPAATRSTSAPAHAPTSKKPAGVVDSVMSYGTGDAQMQIKKRSQSKLDKIQQQQNAKISEGAK